MDFTPKTRRIIVSSIGAIGLVVVGGWVWGDLPADKALIVISTILGGFFSLLKGSE